jgi:uncharacterized protein involved in exopolysaccharide biosynthesis
MTSQQLPRQGRDADTPSWVDLAVTLLRWRRLLVLLPLASAALVVAATLLAAKKYTTTVAFTPVASAGAGLSVGSLAGLAGQFGVNLPMSEPSSSPEFYAYLMRSDAILQRLAASQYSVQDGDEKLAGSFIDLYEIDEGTPGKTMFEAIHQLRTKRATIGYESRTGIVSATIKTKWPELSYQMGVRLLQLVDSFNLQSRQGQAALESQFLTGRLDSARIELRAAENSMQAFLLRNRSYESDPVLLFEQGRLQREVMTRQEVFSVLTQSYEQTRLAALHNTPTVSLVTPPAPALRFDRRRTLTKLIAGLVIGFLLALSIALAMEAVARAREGRADAFPLLRDMMREVIADAKRLIPGSRRISDRS